MRVLAATAVMLGLGCGLGTNPSVQAQSSAAPICDDSPRINADGTATTVGCRFEQQFDNITHHGVHFAPQQLHAGDTTPGVTVTVSCGEWLLGTDADGITVFVDKTTGDVRSHGLMHPGLEVSKLQTLPLPVEAH